MFHIHAVVKHSRATYILPIFVRTASSESQLFQWQRSTVIYAVNVKFASASSIEELFHFQLKRIVPCQLSFSKTFLTVGRGTVYQLVRVNTWKIHRIIIYVSQVTEVFGIS